MAGEVTVSTDEREEGASFISHLPSIIKQRRWLIAIPAVFCAILGVIAAFLLPTKYESKATLLVESPLLPEEMTAAGDTGVLDQRMAKFRQQVLSRPQLIELIRQNSLYTSELRSTSLSDVIDKMRSATSINAVSADIQQSGAGKKGAIAFSLSFTYSEPAKAQAVAQALTEEILELDATKNAAQAGNVVQFLRDQEADLQKQIVALEGQISSIKAANGLALSASGMSGLGISTGSYDAQIAGLQRDNQMLNRQRDLSKTASRDPVVGNAEAQLAAARAVYSESHPDVIFAKQRLEEAKRLATANVAKQPINEIDQQIAFNNAQIAALQSARARDAARSSAALGAQARAPVIEEQISQLQKRLDVLNVQYQGVSARLLNARAGKKAEDEQQGERLTLIDPPVVPEDPISPNRPMLIAGGIAAGIGLGLFLALALEFVMRPIRDANMVRALLGESPLVVIPTISERHAHDRPWYRRLWPFRKRAALATADR
jgi:succinoglycan biosynthesis transport protein ExoP